MATPAVASLGICAFLWNSARAEAVWSPKMPSTRPVSKPSEQSRLWRLGDVVAAQHGVGPVEEPVAQAQPRLGQRGPGHGADLTVDAQAPPPLEKFYSELGSTPRSCRARR